MTESSAPYQSSDHRHHDGWMVKMKNDYDIARHPTGRRSPPAFLSSSSPLSWVLLICLMVTMMWDDYFLIDCDEHSFFLTLPACYGFVGSPTGNIASSTTKKVRQIHNAHHRLFMKNELDILKGISSNSNSNSTDIVGTPADIFNEAKKKGGNEINEEDNNDNENEEDVDGGSKINKLPPMDVLLQRTMDTMEDVVVHLRRIPYETGRQVLSSKQEAARKTIVILGSGWAAHALMKVADCTKLRLIVISPANHFVFTPMLASSAVGTVEYRSMTESIRSANPLIDEYIEGKAVGLDVTAKTVTVELNSLMEDVVSGGAQNAEEEEELLNNKPTGLPLIGRPPNLSQSITNKQASSSSLSSSSSPTPPKNILEVSYDHLIVSVGCRVNDRLVPGAAERALRLKTCDDAVRLRKAIGECFEYASRPDVSTIFASDKARAMTTTTMMDGNDEQEYIKREKTRRVTFVIVGGGPTGVELAGELMDLSADITRPHKGSYPKLKDYIRVVIVHSGPDLVPQFEQPLRIEALKSLQRKGVEVILNTKVTEVGDGYVTLQTKNNNNNDAASSFENGIQGTTILSTSSSSSRAPTAKAKAKASTSKTTTTLPMGMTVWCAGTAPVPFVAELLKQLPKEARHHDGRINVDPWMRPPMKDPKLLGSVLVLGDAAACTFNKGSSSSNEDDNDKEEEERMTTAADGRDVPVPSSIEKVLLPQTAQVAGQQGAYAARILARGYDLTTTPPTLNKNKNKMLRKEKLSMNQQPNSLFPLSIRNNNNNYDYDYDYDDDNDKDDDPIMTSWLKLRGLADAAPPFDFLNLGLLAYLGGGEALGQIQIGDDFPIVSYFGNVAFVLWRSVYLVKQVATRNRILVTFDWIKSAIFGRDMTRF